ncbi:bacterio-opsin activator domain-containing protein [Haloarculaceae archaeon H-GB11]|nr:bacterio-opsin activator domain-containing protein [Haloarculaceae archaeon H-GB11]
MITSDSLARLTLDTLPINIAVLDAEGTILSTNQAWDDFGTQSNLVGENYFENVDAKSDDFAREAVAGIRDVLDGEATLFKQEYPCHSPNQKRWFLMRVAPLTESDEGAAVIAHVDITQRKLAEMAAERRAEALEAERQKLEHLLERIDGLVEEVMKAVTHGESRAEIERQVCERIAAVDPYVLAWVGHEDMVAEELRCSEWAGADLLPDDPAIPLSEAADPTVRAMESGSIQTVQDVADLPEDSLHRVVCGDEPGAVAAIPLRYNDAFYGVLHVYAAETHVFDERETAVLHALGTAISTAINARETRQLLTADRVTELELDVSNVDAFFVDLAATADCTVEYHGSQQQPDGSTAVYLDVAGAPADEVVTFGAEQSDITRVTHLTDFEDTGRFEFVVPEPPVVSLLADYGAETKAITADGDRATMRVELPSTADVREVTDRVEDAYPDVDLLAYRESERPGRTKREFMTALADRLTDRQLMALRKAYAGGFFDWPRGISGEELADSMDVSPATYHQHLRAAERKLVDSFFEE